MRKSLVIFVLLYCFSCADSALKAPVTINTNTTDTTAIQTLTAWLTKLPDKEKSYTSVFVLTPNDCNSCMEMFTKVLRTQLNLQTPETQICVVFPKLRQIERAAVLESAFGDADTTGIPIIWSDTLFDEAHQKAKHIKAGSLLLVYNQQQQLIFSKAGKTVTGFEPELKNIFK